MASKWVYQFNEGDKSMKNLLGGKGANLAEMTSIGLPVPPGFTITTEVCNHYSANTGYPEGVDEQVAAALAALEADTGKKFGDAADPLLLCVRSGARASMPGMMDTILNLGLNDTTVQGVIADDRQPALRLRLLPPLRLHVRRRGARLQARARGRARPLRGAPRGDEEGQGRRRSTPTSTPTTSRSSSPSSRPPSRRRTGSDFPDDPRAAALGRHHAPSSAAGTTTAPSPTAACTTSPTTGARPSTCRPWCTATPATSPAPASPSRAIPPPARTCSTASSS